MCRVYESFPDRYLTLVPYHKKTRVQERQTTRKRRKKYWRRKKGKTIVHPFNPNDHHCCCQFDDGAVCSELMMHFGLLDELRTQ